MAMAQSIYPNSVALERPGPALALVIGLHIGVVVVLISLDVLPLQAPLAALMVRVIDTPPKQAEMTPPRPKPVTRKPVGQSPPEPAPERPQLAAETSTPAVAAAPVTKEIPPLAPLPLAATVPLVAAVSEPRFDAAYLDNPAPVYPALSRRLGEDGRVTLRVFVESSGRPSQIEIKASSGSPRLDQAAQDAVARWNFVPARRGKEAVGAWVLVPIVFNLRG